MEKTLILCSFATVVRIVAKIYGGPRSGSVPFVIQFRPAVGRKTLELPAGLVDPQETCEVAAVRELKEETGLIGTVVDVSPPLYLDPGMSGSAMRIVNLHVDGLLAENLSPHQTLDVGEYCEVVYLKNPNRTRIFELAASMDLLIESNVFACCLE
jgi:8-oxo-dGTP pyrophosphatase MutT (NUDIX family)